MNLFTKEVKIGITGVIALFLIVYGINYLKGINLFKPTNYYYVRYTNILGLAKSNSVYADGFNVGLVRDIYYDYKHPGNVLVEIQVDSEMRIPKGTYAELSEEMLGGVKMNLILPHNAANYFAPGDTLIGGAKTGLMDNVSQTVLPKVENLLPKIDSILTSLNELLANPALKGTLSNVEVMSAQLAATTANLNKFTGKDLPQLSRTMNDVGINLGKFTTNLNQLELDETLQKVNTTMDNIQQMTAKLGQKDNTVGLLLNDDSLYINLNKTATSAASLLDNLQAHPKRYVHFSVFGRKE
ncbi:MAG: MlaD family protein [Bacteroidaceae bacterium]